MIIKEFVTGPYDCHQSVMANIAAYYGHDYQTVALGKIAFMYLHESNSSIGERIDALHLRKGSKRYELLGLEREEYQILISSPKELECLLKKNIPVVVWADLFNCKWNQAYHKYHFEHCYLINGRENDKYLIADPYFEGKCSEQSMEELEEIANCCTIYRKKEMPENKWIMIEEGIWEDAQYYLEKDMGNKIARFSRDLKNMSFSEEFNYPEVDLYAIPLLDNLKIVGEQREAYVELLKYVGKNRERNLLESAKYLRCSGELWRKLRIYFMKMVITRASKYDYALIESYLENIRQLEEEAFKLILKVRGE